MKIYIEYQLTNAATGGGNQFIRNLKTSLAKQGMITADSSEADIILYNGHQNHEKVKQLKSMYPDKTFIHRMDGLQKLYNGPSDTRQDIALRMTNLADGVIFQSKWARNNFVTFGFNPDKKHTIIYNAADPNIFVSTHHQYHEKIRILTTTWSVNMKKGFNTYTYLDRKLDFDRFEYYFIGHSPVKFKNIINLGPKTTVGIADFMKSCDLFISAVQQDACSNSIIEALTMGLRTFVFNSGGNTELVANPKYIFNNNEDLLQKIEEHSLLSGWSGQPCPVLDDAVKYYVDFMEDVCGSKT